MSNCDLDYLISFEAIPVIAELPDPNLVSENVPDLATVRTVRIARIVVAIAQAAIDFHSLNYISFHLINPLFTVCIGV